jgi:hypothetical protein
MRQFFFQNKKKAFFYRNIFCRIFFYQRERFLAFGDKEEMIFRPFCDGNIAFAGNNGVIPNCSSFNKNVGGTYVAGEELKDQKSLKFFKIQITKIWCLVTLRK